MSKDKQGCRDQRAWCTPVGCMKNGFSRYDCRYDHEKIHFVLDRHTLPDQKSCSLIVKDKKVLHFGKGKNDDTLKKRFFDLVHDIHVKTKDDHENIIMCFADICDIWVVNFDSLTSEAKRLGYNDMFVKASMQCGIFQLKQKMIELRPVILGIHSFQYYSENGTITKINKRMEKFINSFVKPQTGRFNFWIDGVRTYPERNHPELSGEKHSELPEKDSD